MEYIIAGVILLIALLGKKTTGGNGGSNGGGGGGGNGGLIFQKISIEGSPDVTDTRNFYALRRGEILIANVQINQLYNLRWFCSRVGMRIENRIQLLSHGIDVVIVQHVLDYSYGNLTSNPINFNFTLNDIIIKFSAVKIA